MLLRDYFPSNLNKNYSQENDPNEIPWKKGGSSIKKKKMYHHKRPIYSGTKKITENVVFTVTWIFQKEKKNESLHFYCKNGGKNA